MNKPQKFNSPYYHGSVLDFARRQRQRMKDAQKQRESTERRTA